MLEISSLYPPAVWSGPEAELSASSSGWSGVIGRALLVLTMLAIYSVVLAVRTESQAIRMQARDSAFDCRDADVAGRWLVIERSCYGRGDP